MKRALFLVLLFASLAHAAPVCHPTRRFPVAQVWTGTFGGSAMTWCLASTIAGLPVYTELIDGRAVCQGKQCPLHRGRFYGTLTNEDQTLPTGGFPHGILDLSAGWARRCTVTGTTQADPPIVNDRVGGVIAATFSCKHGRKILPAIQVNVTRVQ